MSILSAVIMFITLLVFAALLANNSSADDLNFEADQSRAKRMINGDNVSIRDYPHAVSLERLGKHYCGGNIISSHHIVTACHCFDNEQKHELMVRSGSSLREKNGTLHHIDTIACHPKYDSFNIRNDIAVARVREEFKLGKRRKIIQMLNDTELLMPDDNATVAGWGYVTAMETQLAKRLQSMQMRIVNTTVCMEEYMPWIKMSPGQICAEKDHFSGTCRGDSGGGLIYDNMLVGLLSFSANNCDFHLLPAVFTEVAHYHDWIVKKIKSMGPVNRGISGWVCDYFWCPSFFQF